MFQPISVHFMYSSQIPASSLWQKLSFFQKPIICFLESEALLVVHMTIQPIMTFPASLMDRYGHQTKLGSSDISKSHLDNSLKRKEVTITGPLCVSSHG